MTHEAFEPIELGQAEVLIEMIGVGVDEELDEKYTRGVAPYVEFE
jgi:hypothetical protein